MRLNLGAGTVRHRSGYLNVDANPKTNPHIVARVPPIPAEPSSCSHLFASHFVEHLTKDEANELMREAHRVLVVGGEFEIVVPYGLSDDGIADPTHRSLWCERSFWYFTPDARYLGYDTETRFELVECGRDGNEVRARLRKLPS